MAFQFLLWHLPSIFLMGVILVAITLWLPAKLQRGNNPIHSDNNKLLTTWRLIHRHQIMLTAVTATLSYIDEAKHHLNQSWYQLASMVRSSRWKWTMVLHFLSPQKLATRQAVFLNQALHPADLVLKAYADECTV